MMNLDIRLDLWGLFENTLPQKPEPVEVKIERKSVALEPVKPQTLSSNSFKRYLVSGNEESTVRAMLSDIDMRDLTNESEVLQGSERDSVSVRLSS